MVLITGASGFVGSALTRFLIDHYPVRALSRSKHNFSNPNIEFISEFDLTKDYSFEDLFFGVEVVIHCAARVHVMNEKSADPLKSFRRINVDGTMRLASQAAQCGVKRFIYLSSIKVNGEHTKVGHPFTPEDMPRPLDPYGKSKFEAEVAIQKLCTKVGMEFVIIRPPLIYGAGVKGNFEALVRLVSLGIPLPLLYADKNRRSYIALDNLLSFIKQCIDNPCAANQIFLVSDGRDLSTASLLREIANAANKSNILLPLPIWVLKAFLCVIGKRRISERLFGNLQVDISKCHNLLGWVPPINQDQAFKKVFVRQGDA